ncbi:MAG: hypothetical protein GX196_06020 [Clostridiaceae bacterium]|nr:hypothetical protein [Clostridiaceae bacterium]
MIGWWENLTLLEKVFATFAVPATVILAMQTILLIFGLSGFSDADSDFDADGSIDADFDTDFDFDGDFDTDTGGVFDGGADGTGFDAEDLSGLRLFSLRGFVAFFSVFGWTGIVLSKSGLGGALSTFLAFLAGLAIMFVLALFIMWAQKLESKGNLKSQNAIGKSASVYLKIPPKRSGAGKVTLLLQERFVEMEAITDEEEEIPTGKEVLVVGVTNRGACIVKRK